MYFIIKKFLFVFCCVMREKWSFFFALLFFSLPVFCLSVCSFLKTSSFFFRKKQSHHSLIKSLSLSPSLSSVSFRESTCFARVNRERERLLSLSSLCSSSFAALCWKKKS